MSPVMVSVVIPALNAANTIVAQLDALARQTWDGPWEVVVADNGSSDDTVELCRSRASLLPSLTVVRCDRPGTSAARNRGVQAAKGELLLFCDADDEVDARWIAAMVTGLATSDGVGGRIENDLLNEGRPRHLPRHPEGLPVVAGFLPRGLTANLGVTRHAFESIGGFAEDYDYGSDDTEFCWRLQLAGFSLAYVDDAVVHYRHRQTLRSTAIKAYRAGRSRGRLFRDYGPQGMPKPRLPGAVARWVRLGLTVPAVVFSERIRWWWVEQTAGAVGRISGSIAFRVRYL